MLDLVIRAVNFEESLGINSVFEGLLDVFGRGFGLGGQAVDKAGKGMSFTRSFIFLASASSCSSSPTSSSIVWNPGDGVGIVRHVVGVV